MLSIKSMKVFPYSMLKCILSVRRLENARPLFLLTRPQNETNNTWKRNLRYFTTKKDDSLSSSSSSSSDSSSSDSSSSDEEDEKESPKVSDNKQDEKQASSYASNQKLQGLLMSMIDPNSKQEGSVSSMLLNETLKQDEVDVSLKSPSSRMVKKRSEKFVEDVEKAAQTVAESLGGDVQKTESELLNRLLSRQKKQEEADASNKTSVNLSELIVGMKIDRTPASSPPGHSYPSFQRARGEPFGIREKFTPRQGNERRPSQGVGRIRSFEPSVSLYDGERLGIFDPSLEYISQPPLKTWQHLHQRELSLSAIHPPANIFEEMILWTEKGILWKFPINNEQGLEEEKTVPFSEHVFLEKYLVPWCPSKGPIRHFMELVCVGLSKNSYLRVEEKKETILWYRDYFQKKQDVLKAAGIDFDAKVKQIENQ